MRSASFITNSRRQRAKSKRQNGFVITTRFCLVLPFYFLLFTFATPSQRVALLTPDGAEQSKKIAARIGEHLENKIDLLDSDLSLAAYQSVSPTTPFNLTTTESKLIGTAIGCDFFILIKSAIQRRSAFRRDEYYEAYAHVYVVSSRTGRLVFWKNQKFEASKPDAAAKQLYDSTENLATELAAVIKLAQKTSLNEQPAQPIEEVPDADSPLAKDLKAPIPYHRIKPEYTTEAALYGITATVEILVDTDANGAITRTEIVRWAGYGLEESVEKAVRAMSWRPAFRGVKPLAMRFLLRYNFKKIDKED